MFSPQNEKNIATITSLNVRCNTIGAAAATALSGTLATNNTITYLDVSRNEIGDAGATALSGALATNNTITSLDVRLNGIGHTGWVAIVEAISSNRALILKSIGGVKLSEPRFVAILGLDETVAWRDNAHVLGYLEQDRIMPYVFK